MSKKAAGGLSLLVDEKRVNDLVEQTSGTKALLRAAFKVLLFILFLFAYTQVALAEPLSLHRRFEMQMRQTFDLKAPVTLEKVVSMEKWWEYMKLTFLPAVYGDTARYYFPGAQLDKLLPMQNGNRLYSVVARLRMLKIKQGEDCEVPSYLKGATPDCYGPYSEDAEDRGEFGPPSDIGQPEFAFTVNSAGDKFGGEFAKYSPNGFMRAFTADYDKAQKMVDKLQALNFTTMATRALFLEFSVYNFNVGLYAVCRIAFEVAPSGLWSKTFEVDILEPRSLSFLGDGSMRDSRLLALELCLFLFCLFYLFEELSELWGVPRKIDYFADAWNWLDWSNLILIIVSVSLRMATCSTAGKLLDPYLGDPRKQGVPTYLDMHDTAHKIKIVRDLIAFNTVLTWFKAVKYITVIPYITLFMETVTVSGGKIVSFVVIFCMIFYGFVLSYSVAFGEQLIQYRTMWKTFVFLLRTLLGDGDMSNIYDTNPTMAAFIILLFVVALYFLLLNLFSAIIIRGLANAKEKLGDEREQAFANNLARIRDGCKAAAEYFRLERSFRNWFPGLYTRLMNRRKKRSELLKKRDAEYWQRQRATRPDDLLALGPGSPTYGRRSRRALASVAVKDDDSQASDAESEPDLGKLFTVEQLKRTADAGTLDDDHGPPLLGPPGAGGGEPTPETVELVIGATRHVAGGIVERARGARGVLVGEMAESREVLDGVAKVVEVLKVRASNLQKQHELLAKRI